MGTVKEPKFNPSALLKAEAKKFATLDKPPALKVVPKREPVRAVKRGAPTPQSSLADVVVEMNFSRLKSWSLSAYKDYKKCPRALALKRIAKIKEPDSPAMARGTFAHSVCEKFVKKEISWETAVAEAKKAGDKTLYGKKANPIDLEPLKEYLHAAQKKQVVVEGDWAFVENWDDGDWFKNAWLRMKLDVGLRVKAGVYEVTDWKTGRIYDDHKEEEDLYVLAMFLKFPDAHEVRAVFGYLDQGKLETSGRVYRREEMGVLADRWEKKVKPMMSDTTFPCKPNPFCQWCFFRAANAANLPGGKKLCRF
jgi:hypothetical protein